MNKNLRLKLMDFHSLTIRYSNNVLKVISTSKRPLVSFILIALLLFNLPVQGVAKLVDERAGDTSIRVIELNSENERTLETDLEGIGNSTSPTTNNLIEITGGKKTNQYAVLQIEYKSAYWRKKKFTDTKQSTIPDITVLTTIDRFADVFVKSENKLAFTQIYNDPNMVRTEWTTSVPIPPPPPLTRTKYKSKGVAEEIVRGGFTESGGKKLTGKNVVIAVVDTGIDFTHPDFITYDADGNPTSRLLYLWNPALDYHVGRGEKSPLTYPNHTPIGTIFTQQQLTSELRAIKNGATPSIPSTDENGHGTACASIAAGNGNADYCEGGLKRPEVVGVAPDALIIGVRIDKDDLLTNAYLLNAICEWLDTVAGKQAMVISCSFGGNYTAHDGQSVNERELNERFQDGNKKGRIMMAAAGNDARNSIHARVTFAEKKNSRLVSWSAKNPITKELAGGKQIAGKLSVIRMYFDAASATNIRILAPAASTIAKGHLTWELNKITHQIQATLKVEPGDGQIRLFNSKGSQTTADFYFDSSNLGTFKEGVDDKYLIMSPGSAESVLAIGSSEWNNSFHRNGNLIELTTSCQDKDNNFVLFEVGELSCYSSPGPTRDHRYKPDVVAPGEWYSASYARDSTNWKKERLDSIGKYIPMNGTSAATPYAAGIIALLFEKDDSLTTNQVKELLKNNLTKIDLKPFSDKIPNDNWGNGKLDLEAIKRVFELFK